MSSLSPKDRVSLCSFTFSDGRRCRTPRISSHPHFCFYHAQKEARVRVSATLGKDLAYFFSGDYLSACDLSTALGRLIPAVVRGDVKPKTAHTVAYLAQTLMQSIHISQHEYCEAFSSDAWRKSVRNSVNSNHNYRFPPAPKPEPGPAQPESPQPQPQPAQPQTQAQQPTATPVNCHSERSEESAFSFSPAPSPALPSAPQPAPSPHTSLPPTSAEFVQHVVAGLQTGQKSSPPPRASQRSSQDPGPATANSSAPNHASPSSTTPPSPKATPSSPSAPLSPTVATSPAPPQPQAQPPSPQPTCPDQGRRVNPREPDRSAPWLDFTRSIPPDSKLL